MPRLRVAKKSFDAVRCDADPIFVTQRIPLRGGSPDRVYGP